MANTFSRVQEQHSSDRVIGDWIGIGNHVHRGCSRACVVFREYRGQLRSRWVRSYLRRMRLRQPQ